jgi:hypothetical protein
VLPLPKLTIGPESPSERNPRFPSRSIKGAFRMPWLEVWDEAGRKRHDNFNMGSTSSIQQFDSDAYRSIGRDGSLILPSSAS